MKQGKIYIFTGEGKGKTSSALGTVMRAVGNEMRVGWVAWYKQESWKLSEVKSLKKLGVEVYLMGKGFSFNSQESITNDQEIGKRKLIDGSRVVDNATEKEHKEVARKALEKANELLGKVDVLVLDEVNNAANEELIDVADLVSLISKRGNTHLILTGRGVDKRVVELADLVTECRKVKHPYDKGELAVRGLDY